MPAITSSYNAMEVMEPVWQKTSKGYYISCRRVHIPTDVPVLVRWKRILLGPVADVGDIGSALSFHLKDLAGSEDGQPFMLFSGELPLLQVEIVEGWSCHLSALTHLIKKGEYCMFMHFNPEISLMPVMAKALRLVCDWWISEGVPRLWTSLLPTNMLGVPLLMNAGFGFVEQSLPQEESELYTFPVELPGFSV